MATVSSPSPSGINAFDPADPLVRLQDAGAIIPGNPSFTTLKRWAAEGLGGGLKLETIRIGGQRFTSRGALQRFFEAVTSSTDQ